MAQPVVLTLTHCSTPHACLGARLRTQQRLLCIILCLSLLFPLPVASQVDELGDRSVKVGEERAWERILSLRVEKISSTRVYTCSTRPGQNMWWSDRRLATGGNVDLSCVGTTVDIAVCNRTSKSRSDLTITASINLGNETTKGANIIEEEHLPHRVLTDEDNKNTYCLNCADKTENEVRSWQVTWRVAKASNGRQRAECC